MFSRCFPGLCRLASGEALVLLWQSAISVIWWVPAYSVPLNVTTSSSKFPSTPRMYRSSSRMGLLCKTLRCAWFLIRAHFAVGEDCTFCASNSVASTLPDFVLLTSSLQHLIHPVICFKSALLRALLLRKLTSCNQISEREYSCSCLIASPLRNLRKALIPYLDPSSAALLIKKHLWARHIFCSRVLRESVKNVIE